MLLTFQGSMVLPPPNVVQLQWLVLRNCAVSHQHAMWPKSCPAGYYCCTEQKGCVEVAHEHADRLLMLCVFAGGQLSCTRKQEGDQLLPRPSARQPRLSRKKTLRSDSLEPFSHCTACAERCLLWQQRGVKNRQQRQVICIGCLCRSLT